MNFDNILFVALELQLTLREAEELIKTKQIISLMKEEIERGNVEHTYVGSFHINPQHNTSNQTQNKEWKFGNVNPDFELHTKDMPA